GGELHTLEDDRDRLLGIHRLKRLRRIQHHEVGLVVHQERDVGNRRVRSEQGYVEPLVLEKAELPGHGSGVERGGVLVGQKHVDRLLVLRVRRGRERQRRDRGGAAEQAPESPRQRLHRYCSHLSPRIGGGVPAAKRGWRLIVSLTAPPRSYGFLAIRESGQAPPNASLSVTMPASVWTARPRSPSRSGHQLWPAQFNTRRARSVFQRLGSSARSSRSKSRTSAWVCEVQRPSLRRAFCTSSTASATRSSGGMPALLR